MGDPSATLRISDPKTFREIELYCMDLYCSRIVKQENAYFPPYSYYSKKIDPAQIAEFLKDKKVLNKFIASRVSEINISIIKDNSNIERIRVYLRKRYIRKLLTNKV